MKRFLIDVIAPLRAGGTGRAERAAHWTLAAAIVFPIAVFVGASFISLRQTETEARDRLQRNLGTVYEHALKVLETVELTSRYLSNTSSQWPQGHVLLAASLPRRVELRDGRVELDTGGPS